MGNFVFLDEHGLFYTKSHKMVESCLFFVVVVGIWYFIVLCVVHDCLSLIRIDLLRHIFSYMKKYPSERKEIHTY